jgi:hypothetical protein
MCLLSFASCPATIRYLSKPDGVDYLLADVRVLTSEYQSGGSRAPEAFCELLTLLLQATIVPPGPAVRLARSREAPNVTVVGGWRGPTDPVQLTNGRYLRVAVTLFLEPSQRNRLKVDEASFQYQIDRDASEWLFRYDYRRHPADAYAAGHLQIASKTEIPGVTKPLHRLHFPTGRVSIESVIRLLIEDFGVPARTPAAIWRRVLAESEGSFLEIAHRPRSGPSA